METRWTMITAQITLDLLQKYAWENRYEKSSFDLDQEEFEKVQKRFEEINKKPHEN